MFDLDKKTIDDVRIIGETSLEDLFTLIDESYTVHENMRSDTGGTMSMGWGVIHVKSSKQKLNTKSSTEAEVVGVSDYMPYNIWVVMFLEEQGYRIFDNILFHIVIYLFPVQLRAKGNYDTTIPMLELYLIS